mmetsp:Transcript_22053/g.43825  ORF Transcript_22053/g.43825 Transcript_22053/m.43825 type:complete len:352 (-) Transcript_22053:442-1497(-)|eukprot:CAMPEP_0175163760 /NCGR_PEP_ID=MMETSP0087-20121206/25966_1 /TAXON_ID=136419 /ORGANISM="Unknown Unknown, Strain D1" /LENGTH=351 /DNA_ID=CAMNT_0016452575 /DNA_START=44 /DNA_END=1099 /DNA_ORIENTATION=+
MKSLFNFKFLCCNSRTPDEKPKFEPLMKANQFLQPGDIHKYYELKESLGSGAYAVVKRAVRKKDKAAFACKIIKKSKLGPEELNLVLDEVDIMHKINHENCISLHEIFESKKSVYLVMELLTGGELFDRIVQKGTFSEKEASDVLKCIVSAMQYLHGIGIVHRDLKPENLLYASSKGSAPLKITDFGLAKLRRDGDNMNTACGTPGYVAPEIIKKAPYGPAVDLWSIGVIMYILLCGFPPFYHESTAALYKQIKKGDFEFPSPYWDEISDAAKNLISGLLTVDPKKRLTSQGVLDHPWVSGGAASSQSLSQEHVDRFKVLQAKATLRRAVRTLIAMYRFKVNLDKLAGDLK